MIESNLFLHPEKQDIMVEDLLCDIPLLLELILSYALFRHLEGLLSHILRE